MGFFTFRKRSLPVSWLRFINGLQFSLLLLCLSIDWLPFSRISEPSWIIWICRLNHSSLLSNFMNSCLYYLLSSWRVKEISHNIIIFNSNIRFTMRTVPIKRIVWIFLLMLLLIILAFLAFLLASIIYTNLKPKGTVWIIIHIWWVRIFSRKVQSQILSWFFMPGRRSLPICHLCILHLKFRWCIVSLVEEVYSRSGLRIILWRGICRLIKSVYII